MFLQCKNRVAQKCIILLFDIVYIISIPLTLMEVILTLVANAVMTRDHTNKSGYTQ